MRHHSQFIIIMIIIIMLRVTHEFPPYDGPTAAYFSTRSVSTTTRRRGFPSLLVGPHNNIIGRRTFFPINLRTPLMRCRYRYLLRITFRHRSTGRYAVLWFIVPDIIHFVIIRYFTKISHYPVVCII
jgi:hypothetical protein